MRLDVADVLRHLLQPRGDAISRLNPLARLRRGLVGILLLHDDVRRLVFREFLGEFQVIAKERHVGAEELVLVGGDVEPEHGRADAERQQHRRRRKRDLRPRHDA